ncbi:MAG TPA: undecaprenyl-phosphate glucose phosphotransferase [Steroidobacteraceae bacterium]|nr:undecaprenyl-phosphate glucose phosphotransferase [Steroidobacteraceae bacterium]
MSSVVESFAHRRVRLGNVEPAAVALLKQLDPLIVFLSLFGCEFVYHDRLTPALGAYATLVFIVTSQLFNRLDIREVGNSFSDFSRTYARIVLQWASVIAVLLFAAFAFKVSANLSRRVVLTWFAVTPVLLSAVHAVRMRAHWFAANGASAPRHIIVGVNEVGFELSRRLPPNGFMGYFDFRSIDRLASVIEPDKLTGHCTDVADYVRSHGINIVYIALPLCNVPRMSTLVNALRDTTASVYFVPDAFAFDLIQSRFVEINGMPALSVCDTPFHGMDAVLKRATDVVFASVALALVSPLMLLVAAAVKCTSSGPALFRQRRYGLNGEEILVYKFRSMTTTEDGAEVKQATRQDPRVTPVGRFIRKTSIDELPQLFNVLQGTMSLVGPRPHAVAHNELYRKLISGYMIRHKVRPGITGLAQVNGMRGETETLDKMSERVRFDLEYLRYWSPWMDLKIIFKTLGLVLHVGKNVY